MNILNGDVSSDSDSSDNSLYPSDLDESDIVPGMTAEDAQTEAAANEEFESDSSDSSESEFDSDDEEDEDEDENGEIFIDDDEDSSDGPSTEKEAMLNKLQSMLSKLKSGNPAVFETDDNNSEE